MHRSKGFISKSKPRLKKALTNIFSKQNTYGLSIQRLQNFALFFYKMFLTRQDYRIRF